MEVPITPGVLSWAVEESGYTDEQLAAHIGVSLDDLASWKRGDTRPTLTPLKKLATRLHRQFATFLLPAPPKRGALRVQFRSIGSQPSRELSPIERRYLRRAGRQQEIIGWLSQELNEPAPHLPRHSPSDSPTKAGAVMRDRLNIEFSQQASWTSPSRAFDHWREAVGGIGVTVFVYSLGRDSCNGFSLWHARAPVIVVSSAWREEARIFTLFHELGHLLLRGSSACLERVGRLRNDPDRALVRAVFCRSPPARRGYRRDPAEDRVGRPRPRTQRRAHSRQEGAHQPTGSNATPHRTRARQLGPLRRHSARHRQEA